MFNSAPPNEFSLASSGVPTLDGLLGGGYPSRSAILVEGRSGNERDTLIYQFVQIGLGRGEFCAYVTRHHPSEVISDAKALGIDLGGSHPYWISPEGGDRGYSLDDLATISFSIKEVLRSRAGGSSRVAFDGLSQLLMLHSTDSVYRFLSQLLPELKKSGVVILFTLQDDMHQPQVVSSLELLFDGVVRVLRAGNGETEVQVNKMRGVGLAGQPKAPLTGGREKGPGGTTPRLAVLPFTSISPDPNDAYLSDGLTEELISTLSRLEGLDVIARTSVMHYKASPKPVVEIARELNVGTILEGSTRKGGNKLRVTVQMIDAEQDRHLWAVSYDREIEDVFAIQTEISEAVAEHVKLKFRAEGRVSRGVEQDPVAYDYYLKGRHLLNAARSGPEGAERYFRLAIEKDPKFAKAYTGLSDYYSYAADDTMSSAEAYPRAKEYARRALELDPDLSEAHGSLALIAFLYEWDWPAAETHFADSIRLNSNNAFAHHWYGLLLKALGRFEEAAISLERALELDPFSSTTRFAAAVVKYCNHQYDLALTECRKALDLEGAGPAVHGLLGVIYLARHDRDAALREAREADLGMADRAARGLIGYLFGKLGENEDARRILAGLGAGTDPDPYAQALVHLGLGERSEAVAKFEAAAKRRSSYFPLFSRQGIFDELADDPRVTALLTKSGLG